MTMSVNLIEGNILTPPTRNENTIICHQVNCRAAMGAGLARQIRDKWPVVFDEYVKVCSPKKLGDFQVVQVAPQLYVANLFGQLSFGRDKRQTNYAALGTALFRAMKEHPDATFLRSLRSRLRVGRRKLGDSAEPYRGSCQRLECER